STSSSSSTSTVPEFCKPGGLRCLDGAECCSHRCNKGGVCTAVTTTSTSSTTSSSSTTSTSSSTSTSTSNSTTTSSSSTTVPRFVNNGDGTITDLSTGLQWEQKTGTVGGGSNPSDPHDVNNTYPWCADGNVDTACDAGGAPDGA